MHNDPMSLSDILIRRIETDNLLEVLRVTGNSLGSGLARFARNTIQPGLRNACAQVDQLYEEVDTQYRRLLIVRESQTSELPSLSKSQLDDLEDLDRQILSLAPALENWFAEVIQPSVTPDKLLGKWNDVAANVVLGVELRGDFDVAYTQGEPQILWLNFAGVRMSAGQRSTLIDFRTFADEPKSVQRPELANIRSTLLREILPRLPELAFGAELVNGLTVDVSGRQFYAPIELNRVSLINR